MAATRARYDDIGRSYSTTRREDPRIAAPILRALGSGSVLNVGAGSGNYEPTDRPVVALEPSAQMVEHRPAGTAPAVRGMAESIPFADRSFDVALAILTVHHWGDPVVGLRELARVADRQVVFYFETEVTHRFWALDYFPEAFALPTEVDPPGETLLRAHLDIVEITPVLIPHDCMDGFGAAYWGRPEAYLDPDVQAGMSWLALLSESARHAGTERLRAALDSGEWDRRHGALRSQEWFDGGYRLAVATGPART